MTTSQRLYLSSEIPWNASYMTSEGYIVYKTEPPPSWTEEVKTIKLLRANPPYSESTTTNVSFSTLAEIQYRNVHKAQIQLYDGRDSQPKNVFFRKKGLSFLGPRNRVFMSPIGGEYMWKIGSTSKLFSNDSRRNPVAVFHKAKGGIIRRSRPAYLEISVDKEELMDIIVATFVYMEKLRMERKDIVELVANAVSTLG
ncbi:hypothetical protein JR316_0002920 [Psilocybe cubensis]|uniref:DUF6593 domain-containing protein n=2 Tax=Psilocybe cubensis TaxID=181762 RepID=A0A8H7Y3Z6_PSICU|nr:hypothetical protein JR316_0002920 [Psilocybe cubensis]KAH9483452.1 hypothetical protein JR316_0002920 [Psilocybe cubensis]